MFLVQYWGGPRTYSEQRGHPRLRMRHVPFRIGLAERDAWLGHMRDAVDSLELPPEAERLLWDYLVMAAASLVNSDRRQPAAGPLGRLARILRVTSAASDRRQDPTRPRVVARPPSSTRSTSAASPTATVTASATSPASGHGCPTCATSASTRSGSRRSTRRRWPTAGTTSPTTATSSRCSAPWPTPTP